MDSMGVPVPGTATLLSTFMPASASNASYERPILSAPGAAGQMRRKARFWDRIARKYATDPIADMAGYEMTLARVSALLSPAHAVLEIGCGTGTTAMRLAPLTGHMVATDVAQTMIEIAEERLREKDVPQLVFAVADADAPAFGAERYDRVLAFNLLHLVDDLDQAIGSAMHTLRPGGLFITKTPCVSEMNPLIWRLALPLMRLVGKAPPVICFDEPQLLDAMTRNGLEILQVERHGTKGKDIRAFIVARKPD